MYQMSLLFIDEDAFVVVAFGEAGGVEAFKQGDEVLSRDAEDVLGAGGVETAFLCELIGQSPLRVVDDVGMKHDRVAGGLGFVGDVCRGEDAGVEEVSVHAMPIFVALDHVIDARGFEPALLEGARDFVDEGPLPLAEALPNGEIREPIVSFLEASPVLGLKFGQGMIEQVVVHANTKTRPEIVYKKAARGGLLGVKISEGL